MDNPRKALVTGSSRAIGAAQCGRFQRQLSGLAEFEGRQRRPFG